MAIHCKIFWKFPFILQDDNAPWHDSQLTTAWENENDLDCLNFPVFLLK